VNSTDVINQLKKMEEALGRGDKAGFEEQCSSLDGGDGCIRSLTRITFVAYHEREAQLRKIYKNAQGEPLLVENKDTPLSLLRLPSLREFEDMLKGLDEKAYEEGLLSLEGDLERDDLSGFVKPVLFWCVDGVDLESVYELVRVYFTSKKAEIDNLLDCLQLISDNLGPHGDFMASRHSVRDFGQYGDTYSRIADWLDNSEISDFPSEEEHAFLFEWAGLMEQYRTDPPGMSRCCARLCRRVREEFALVCRMVWLTVLSVTDFERDDSTREPLCFDYLPWSDDVLSDPGSRRQEVKRAHEVFEASSVEIRERSQRIIDFYTDMTLSLDSSACADENCVKRMRAEKLAALASDMKEKQFVYNMKSVGNWITFFQENRERINGRISELTGRESYLRDID